MESAIPQKRFIIWMWERRECVVVSDAFYAGYQSLTGLMNGMENSFRNYEEPQISYTVMRRENLFSKENQDILFTMSQ